MYNIYNIRPKGFNVGNDMIYVAVQHFLRKAMGNNSFNLISLPATNKYESQKKAGFTSNTIYEINQFGHGVILGGGNLYENGEIDINPTALKALEKPLMIFSVSRGRIYNSKLNLVDRTDVITDKNLRLLNEKAFVSMSRDQATTDYITNLGVDNVNGACPTLFLNEMPMHLIPGMKSIETDCIISIRTPSLMSIPPTYQYELRDRLLGTISLLKKKGYKNIKLLCHDHRDIPFASSFKEVDFLYTDDIYTFISILKNTKLNITYRLHSFIPCLSLNIPTIKISYDERALSLIDTIGMDEWNINYVKDDVIKEIENRIDNLGDLKPIKNKLETTVWADIKQTIESNFERYTQNIIANK